MTTSTRTISSRTVAVGAAAVLAAGAVVTASPASADSPQAAPPGAPSAAASCGNTTWLKIQDEQVHGVVQSCGAGAQVVYTISCGPSGSPFPITSHTVTVSRYFPVAQTGQVTKFRCSAPGSPAQAEDLTTVTGINWEYA